MPRRSKEEAVTQTRTLREAVLEALYEAEVKGESSPQELKRSRSAFVAERIAGVHAGKAEIDSLLSKHLIGWEISRVTAVDLSIMRLGIWELMAKPDVPTGVILSEATRLADRYSTGESAKFVNGVLSAAAAEIRP